jgi:hypothetical protein
MSWNLEAQVPEATRHLEVDIQGYGASVKLLETTRSYHQHCLSVIAPLRRKLDASTAQRLAATGMILLRVGRCG